MNAINKLKAAGIVQTVAEILAESDEDRAARETAAAMSNEPPEDAVDVIRKTVDEAYEEALLWLDGENIANQQQADDLGRIFKALDDAYKLAESERVAAKKPHDDAAAEVQRTFKPIVDKADKARKAVKTAIQRWNDHLADLQRQEAARVRQAAIDAAAAAQKLIDEAARENNLAAMEVAEQQRENAAVLADMAKAAESEKAVTQIEGARGIGRSTRRWVGHLDADPLDLDAVRTAEHALMTWAWKGKRAWLLGIIMDEAQRDIRAGARVIPGLKIEQE